ncbi:MAG: sulfotransferase domain-containing protein, partial [Gammaproteobacteria bacterium]|nr:sulfotransferase domain-containing protein [Gammaproteobacteria bacterium]
IHVARNGLDMAYSDNQNQLVFWGDHLLGHGWELTPYYSLKFWRVAHERILRLGAQLGERFLFLRHDSFCENPLESTRRMLEFAGIEAAPEKLAALARLVRTPTSVGRYNKHDWRAVDPADVAFVRQMGFNV